MIEALLYEKQELQKKYLDALKYKDLHAKPLSWRQIVRKEF